MGLRRAASPRDRSGFALVAVLWVLVGLTALGLAAQLAAQQAVATARNRADLRSAAWRAEGCVERARTVVARSLRAAEGEGPNGPTWNAIGRILAESPLTAGCDLEVRAAGATLDANRAGGETLRRLLQQIEIPTAPADSLADALLDWIDADDEPRPYGAEAAYYRAARLPGPRNGALADPRELLRVRGMSRLAGIDTLLGTDPARLALNQAPLAVVAALPGMTPEIVARLRELRARGEYLTEGAAPQGLFASPAAPGSRPGEPVQTTTHPDAWIVTARGHEGEPPATAVLEVRLVRAGPRAAVVRRRGWTE